MIVCVCHQVSDHEIARHVQLGLDFSDLQLELGVATQCGRCERCAREAVRHCQARTGPEPTPGTPLSVWPATWSPA